MVLATHFCGPPWAFVCDTHLKDVDWCDYVLDSDDGEECIFCECERHGREPIIRHPLGGKRLRGVSDDLLNE